MARVVVVPPPPPVPPPPEVPGFTNVYSLLLSGLSVSGVPEMLMFPVLNLELYYSTLLTIPRQLSSSTRSMSYAKEVPTEKPDTGVPALLY